MDIPLTILSGHDDGHVTPEQIEAWRLETTADCDVRWFEGNHFSVEQNSAELADFLQEARLCDKSN